MGIGLAIAKELAKEGCNIVINSRTRKDVQKVAKEIKKMGIEALPIAADVSNPAEVRQMIKETIKTFGRIDILVNNAGVIVYKDFKDTNQQEIDYVADINLKGTLICTSAVLPIMIKQRYGRIINISSGAGKTGIPGMAVYSATKFAVIGFTESIADELKNHGIKVYAVCPGGVDTRMYTSTFGEIPSLKPHHIAKKILPLCMPDVKTKSGSSIEVYHKWM
jgi:3-oxoacyl-[acyl-carrier protein] reductase